MKGSQHKQQHLLKAIAIMQWNEGQNCVAMFSALKRSKFGSH